ncbi:MAG: SGNH/GDSL hydrolase family protein [Hyphomicrobiaceae bacterium]
MSASNLKTVAINLAVLAILYIALASVFFLINSRNETGGGAARGTLTANTIRSTYPNYSSYEPRKALEFFVEYSAPKTGYQPFVGYRRAAFSGGSVTIDKEFGFRTSTNHAVSQSIWFLGGSTMWGTGSPDEATIPSLVAQQTGERVLNLGESGYTSFQELVQLQLLLAKGYRPKRVVFYDGVNDGYFNCQKGEPIPTHAYRARFSEMLENYSELKQRADKNVEAILGNASTLEWVSVKLKGSGRWIGTFLKSPFAYFLPESNDTDKGLAAATPFSRITKSKTYLHCHDPDLARVVARTMVTVWLQAHTLLKGIGIPVTFVLQPAATYEPEEYMLDYIVDSVKQNIVDESDSYREFYRAVKAEWASRCEEQAACSDFLDLSAAFRGSNIPIFIDTCHVSPNGNRIIAERMATAAGLKAATTPGGR